MKTSTKKIITTLLFYLSFILLNAQCPGDMTEIHIAWGNSNYDEENPILIYDSQGNIVYESAGVEGGGMVFGNACVYPDSCYTVHTGWFFEIGYTGCSNVICKVPDFEGSTILPETIDVDFSVNAPCGNALAGCTNHIACNYNPSATWEDESCIFGFPDIEALLSLVEIDDVQNQITIASETVGEDLVFSWDFGDGTTSNEEFPTHDYPTDSTYTLCLTITNNNGCEHTACLEISLLGKRMGNTSLSSKNKSSGFHLTVIDEATIAVEEQEKSEENIRVFQNSSGDRLNIIFNSLPNGEVNYMIFDMTGKMLDKNRLNLNSKAMQINLKNFGTGNYLLLINQGEHLWKEKFFIK